MTRRSSQSGFSLIELLVTSLIFAIGLLGLSALQLATLRSNSGGRNRFTAAALAEGCLSAIQSEGSRSWAYAAGLESTATTTYPVARIYTGATSAGTYGAFDINGQPLAIGNANTLFTVTWTKNAAVAPSPTTPITGMNLREFVVTVTWQDQAVGAAGTALAPSTMSMSRLIRY
jgi:type IV pilus assembly protein PilV